MPSFSKSPLRLSDSVSSRVSRALRKAASRRFSGFTLAELIVVVAILAILATIGFLALSGYREDAKDSAVKTNVRSVYAAIAAESATLQKSARCFIRHSPTHALTGGAVVMFDGGVADTLVGGDCGTPGTNYSAGNPDYAALKLDPAKFRVSLLSSPRPAAAAMGWPGASQASAGPAPGDEYVADPSLLLVGAADLTDSSGSKPRVRTFVQVAAVLPSETAYVAGDFPSGDVDDASVAGLIKDAAYTESSTGALVDGASTGAPAPCEAGEVSGYSVPALSSGQRQEVRKDVANGEGVATARCSYGTVRIEDEAAACDPDYVPANPVPSCVRDACGWTFPADAVSNEITPGGTGTWTFDETPGTCRFKCASGFTWDGSACRADCAVSAASPSYQSLSYGLVANLPIAHGATAAGTGTHAFGTAPANGELQVSFSYSCDEGVATPTPTEIGGSCYGAGHDWNSDFAAPACVLRTYSVSGSFWANANGATVSVCGQNVAADASGNFSRTGIPYGTACDNVTATRAGYSCTTTTDGPASLAANVTNVAGTCSLIPIVTNPMTQWNSVHLESGSWTQNATSIYAAGVSYNGGHRLWAMHTGNSFVLDSSKPWYLDFKPNKNGINSPPYPNYTIGLSVENSAVNARNKSSGTWGNYGQFFDVQIGNAYSLYFSHWTPTGTQTYSSSFSSYAYADYSMRIAHLGDWVIRFYASSNPNWTSMVQLYSYTPSSWPTQPLRLLIAGRSDGDGWKDVRFTLNATP